MQRQGNFERRPSQYWHLAERVSLLQATLLVLDIEPQGHDKIMQQTMKPEGFDAVYSALKNGLASDAIIGHICYYKDESRSFTSDPPTIDPHESDINVDSLKSWLKRKGYSKGFLLGGVGSSEPYLDKDNPRYAPKLAAAIYAWLAVGKTGSTNQTPKQAMMKWLRENATNFELTDEDGKPREQAIEELAKVANWEPSGGAPSGFAPDPALAEPDPEPASTWEIDEDECPF